MLWCSQSQSLPHTLLRFIGHRLGLGLTPEDNNGRLVEGFYQGRGLVLGNPTEPQAGGMGGVTVGIGVSGVAQGWWVFTDIFLSHSPVSTGG